MRSAEEGSWWQRARAPDLLRRQGLKADALVAGGKTKPFVTDLRTQMD